MSIILLVRGVFVSFVVGVLYEVKNNVVCGDKVSPSVHQSVFMYYRRQKHLSDFYEIRCRISLENFSAVRVFVIQKNI
jgi:hypothetical protein